MSKSSFTLDEAYFPEGKGGLVDFTLAVEPKVRLITGTFDSSCELDIPPQHCTRGAVAMSFGEGRWQWDDEANDYDAFAEEIIVAVRNSLKELRESRPELNIAQEKWCCAQHVGGQEIINPEDTPSDWQVNRSTDEGQMDVVPVRSLRDVEVHVELRENGPQPLQEKLKILHETIAAAVKRVDERWVAPSADSAQAEGNPADIVQDAKFKEKDRGRFQE